MKSSSVAELVSTSILTVTGPDASLTSKRTPLMSRPVPGPVNPVIVIVPLSSLSLFLGSTDISSSSYYTRPIRCSIMPEVYTPPPSIIQSLGHLAIESPARGTEK